MKLTQTETIVLSLVADGRSIREMANDLGISYSGVCSLNNSIYKKLKIEKSLGVRKQVALFCKVNSDAKLKSKCAEGKQLLEWRKIIQQSRGAVHVN